LTDQIILYPELDYVGAVKFQGRWRIYYSVLAMWVLDYTKYDPDYDPEETIGRWRADLLVVDNNNAEQYCQAMNELSLEDFRRTLFEVPDKDGQSLYSKPSLDFVVDFDDRLFVNGWRELVIPFHKLIPEGWKGIKGYPYEYIPSDLKELLFKE
jgi:hypothetical protein